MSRQEIFTDIYTNAKWGDKETKSGEGSLLANTTTLRTFLPGFLRRFGIRTLIDAPCGDYNWFKSCAVNLDSYIGLDIVPAMIEDVQKRYGDSKHTFRVADICVDPIPRADVILCRDCLMHLSDEDAIKAIRNFVKSGSTYALLTTNPKNPSNVSIQTGGFRHCNLTKPPFNFPEPIALLQEHFQAYSGMFDDKSLGLWKLEDLAKL